MSPTQRAIIELKAMNFPLISVQEKWNPFAKVRQDLWGFGDILAGMPGVGPLIIQVTSGDNHAARVGKIIAEPRSRAALNCGFRIEVWSFAKRGARGKRKTWKLRRQEVTLNDLGME